MKNAKKKEKIVLLAEKYMSMKKGERKWQIFIISSESKEFLEKLWGLKNRSIIVGKVIEKRLDCQQSNGGD